MHMHIYAILASPGLGIRSFNFRMNRLFYVQKGALAPGTIGYPLTLIGNNRIHRQDLKRRFLERHNLIDVYEVSILTLIQ